MQTPTLFRINFANIKLHFQVHLDAIEGFKHLSLIQDTKVCHPLVLF